MAPLSTPAEIDSLHRASLDRQWAGLRTYDSEVVGAACDIGRVRLTDNDGYERDGEFTVEPERGRLSLVLHSASGRTRSGGGRNTDYRAVLALLLDRLRDRGAVIVDALVDSSATQDLPEPARRLVSEPIRLADHDDVTGVRLRLTRAFYSGWYWSSTTAGHVAYESRLELARILLADFDPSVCAIVAQPFQMTEIRDGAIRRHVPDLLLVHVDRRVTAVDVKPRHRLDDPSVRSLFDWTADVAGLRGWSFEAWSNEDPVVLANVRHLAGYRRPFVVDLSLKELVLDLVDRQGTVGGVEYAASPAATVEQVRPVLLHLLWSGVLQTNLSRPLGPASPVWAGGSR